MDTLTEAWQPDITASDEVEKAMAELSKELSEESESEAMLPWFLIEQAY